jgi:hypothetical protein
LADCRPGDGLEAILFYIFTILQCISKNPPACTMTKTGPHKRPAEQRIQILFLQVVLLFILKHGFQRWRKGAILLGDDQE